MWRRKVVTLSYAKRHPLDRQCVIGGGMEAIGDVRATGIYCIHSVSSDVWYVGQSVDMKHRKENHFYELKRNTHGNKRLQNTYNKYGKDDLVFYALEYCEVELLTKREQFYYDYFKDTLGREMCNFSDFVDAPTRFKPQDTTFSKELMEIYLEDLEENLDGPMTRAFLRAVEYRKSQG